MTALLRHQENDAELAMHRRRMGPAFVAPGHEAWGVRHMAILCTGGKSLQQYSLRHPELTIQRGLRIRVTACFQGDGDMLNGTLRQRPTKVKRSQVLQRHTFDLCAQALCCTKRLMCCASCTTRDRRMP